MEVRRRRVLLVGGHDPSGAGIDADRHALLGLALDSAEVITARTDQDASGVRSVGARAAGEWLAEARAAAALDVDAIKFGLLPGAEHVRGARRFVEWARRERGPALEVVVDPVIAASSGGTFLDEHAVEALRGDLLGAGVVLTPNLSEAARLARLSSKDLVARRAARLEAARILLGLGARAVVLKGGHGVEDPASDLVLDASGTATWLEHPRTPAGKLRGSGCRFATRLAARLASGWDLVSSARDAAQFVSVEIARGAARGGP